MLSTTVTTVPRVPQQKKDNNNNNNDVDKMLQDNIALVRLLLMLSRSGDKGISTVELLKKLKSSHYGQQMIKLAESKGYVERINVKQPEEGRKGGSKTFVINRLSQKGKKLVAKLITEGG